MVKRMRNEGGYDSSSGGNSNDGGRRYVEKILERY